VLFAELGFGGPDRLGEAFVGDVRLLRLLLGVLELGVKVAEARVVDTTRSGRWFGGWGGLG
jgi:hypothetical protein